MRRIKFVPLFAIIVLGCSRHFVTERVPALASVSTSPVAAAYVDELVRTRPGLGESDRRSPDGTHVVEIVADKWWRGDESTGFYGLELRTGNTTLPLVSFWEADVGSGIAAGVRWSGDSRALRISGSTKGYTRSEEGFRQFDMIYLVEADTFYDITAPPNISLNRWRRARSGPASAPTCSGLCGALG